jgi:hypothetical protein
VEARERSGRPGLTAQPRRQASSERHTFTRLLDQVLAKEAERLRIEFRMEGEIVEARSVGAKYRLRLSPFEWAGREESKMPGVLCDLKIGFRGQIGRRRFPVTHGRHRVGSRKLTR